MVDRAGWGLILTYAIYVDRNEDIVVNSAAIGLGNNVASLLAGMAILPTAFAILSTADAETAMASGNTGLTFIWIPQLFERVPGGAVILPMFFLALFCAALSSLIAMVELAARVLIDTGMSRTVAVRFVGAATIVCGVPAATSMAVFENQDWVWGLALMLSGLFISIAVTRYGRERFRNDLINAAPGVTRLGPAFEWVVTFGIPVQFVLMFGWWMYQTVSVYDPDNWFNPIRLYSLGTCLAQWGIALSLLWIFNDRLARGSLRTPADSS